MLNQDDYSMIFYQALMAADEATNSDHLEARVVDRCLKLHADRDRCNTLYEQHLRYKVIKRAIHQTASIICEIAPVVGDRDNYDTKLLELLYQRTIPDVEFLHKTTQLHGQLTMEVDKDLIMLICGAESTHPITLYKHYDVITPQEVESRTWERRNL